MRGLDRTLRELGALRSRLERRLAERSGRSGPMPPARAPADAVARTSLTEVADFGSNPGNLRMWLHVPSRLARQPALVVALHGCEQTAAGYAIGSGWAELADRHGFILLLPEQRQSNNPKLCFSWYQPDDTARDSGEALSIHQMVAQARSSLGVAPDRVFVTGLSAGGAMTAVLLATYPEDYAAGAVIAGLPYRAAATLHDALKAMFVDQHPSDRVLLERVTGASRHKGAWPRVSIWHGDADAIVKPSNGDHLVRQWTQVHGLPRQPSGEERVGRHVRRFWAGSSGQPIVEQFVLAGIGHGVPIDSGGSSPLGTAGPYFLEAGISSSERIARSWGIGDGAPRLVAGAARASADIVAPTRERPSTDASAMPHSPPSLVGWHRNARMPGTAPLAPSAPQPHDHQPAIESGGHISLPVTDRDAAMPRRRLGRLVSALWRRLGLNG